jgi:hypothetical protein
MSIDEHGLKWAKKFHEAYERLAPSFGYETRTDTRQFESESKNGQLMIAVCGELVAAAEAAARQAALASDADHWHKNYDRLNNEAGRFINNMAAKLTAVQGVLETWKTAQNPYMSDEVQKVICEIEDALASKDAEAQRDAARALLAAESRHTGDETDKGLTTVQRAQKLAREIYEGAPLHDRLSGLALFDPDRETEHIATAISAAERTARKLACDQQLERDCALVCEYCGNPDTAESNVHYGRAELIEGVWQHKRTSPLRDGLYPDRCQAGRLRQAFALIPPLELDLATLAPE